MACGLCEFVRILQATDAIPVINGRSAHGLLAQSKQLFLCVFQKLAHAFRCRLCELGGVLGHGDPLQEILHLLTKLKERKLCKCIAGG